MLVNGETQRSFAGLAHDGARKVERALVHLAKVIELDLASIALEPGLLSNEYKEEYNALAGKLAEVGSIVSALVADIGETVGLDTEVIDYVHDPKNTTDPPSAYTFEETKPVAAKNGQAHIEPSCPDETSDGQGPGTNLDRNTTNSEDTTDISASYNGDNHPIDKSEDTRKLYGRIVDISELPIMNPVEEGSEVTMYLHNQNQIVIGARRVALSGHEIFLLNSLLLQRKNMCSATDLKALGFYPEATNSTTISTVFSKTMKSLMEKINGAVDNSIILKQGKTASTRYAFNPKVILEDKRTAEDKLNASSDIVLKKN